MKDTGEVKGSSKAAILNNYTKSKWLIVKAPPHHHHHYHVCSRNLGEGK